MAQLKFVNLIFQRISLMQTIFNLYEYYENKENI